MSVARRPTVLVVDDDPAVIDLVVEVLASRYDAAGVTSAAAALARMSASDIDLVISDIQMPEQSGLDLLAAMHERKPGQLVVLMTAFASVELAVQAVRAGASDLVTKPFRPDALILAIERALRDRTMRREVVRLRGVFDEAAAGLVARSPVMQRVVALATGAARGTSGVVLAGERGVGKRTVASWIHACSDRAAGAFAQLDCAQLPGEGLDRELAAAPADGTLFLDNVEALPLEAQAQVIQAIDAGRLRARVIAATTVALEGEIKEGRFRRELYYRLGVIRIPIPPLRERPEDVPELIDRFLARAARGAQAPLGITDDAIRWLGRQPWPGNVRQLAHVIARAVAMTEHDTLRLDDVMLDPSVVGDALGALFALAAARHLPLATIEERYVKAMIDDLDGNMSRAARILGIDRRTLYRKLAT